MKKIEVLAPAGNMECLVSAVMAGCDAVYLSGNMFGARTFANNFDYNELKKAVIFAHMYDVKVYVTINTVIYDKEVATLLSYIDYLVSINIDALIIQDIGILELINKIYPDLELHASTQMHVHNLDGAKLVKKLGAKRIVLARELSLEQIKYIKDNIDVEVEVFTHGALCVSYSSQCLMSSLIGNRSGNRGSCAGSCRQLYSLVKIENNNEIIITDNKYLLSMKDLNNIKNVDKLIDSGIDSLKIEGRMKRSSYVYMVTSMYRKAVDSYLENKKIKLDIDDQIKLSKIFDRGSTKGFLFDEKSKEIVNTYRPNHMGVNIGQVIDYKNNFVTVLLNDSVSIFDGIRILDKIDYGLELNVFSVNREIVKEAVSGDKISFKVKTPITIGSKVVKTTDYKDNLEIKKIVESNFRKVLIKGKLRAEIDKPLILELLCDDKKVVVESEYLVCKASNSPMSKDLIMNKINKLGDTVYKFSEVNIEMNDNIFIPNKVLNDIRREAIDLLTEKRLERKSIRKYKYEFEELEVPLDYGSTIKLYDEKLIDKINKNDYLNIYANGSNTIYKDNLIPFTINVLNNKNSYTESKLIGDLGSINKDMISDYSFNVTNSYTVNLLHRLGVRRVKLSYEMEYTDIEKMIFDYKNRYGHLPNLELIVFGKVEAMHLKYQIEGINNDEIFALKDRFNNLYLLKNIDNTTFIFNHQYRQIKDLIKYKNLGINVFRYQLLNDDDFNLFNKIKE